MPLTYRCLLMPTAAFDTTGAAQADVVFTVTPAAGGSAVAVYAAASGGSALASNLIKTDALGNISGFYVVDAGPYVLTFVGGVTVVTAAVFDPLDIATTADVAPSDYVYDPNTFPPSWTISPGVGMGCAIYDLSIGDTNSATLVFSGAVETVPNPDVVFLGDVADPGQPGDQLYATTPGLYLVSMVCRLTKPGGGNRAPGSVEALQSIILRDSTSAQLVSVVEYNVPAVYGTQLMSCMPVLLGPYAGLGMTIEVYSETFSYDYAITASIIRLN